MSRFVEIHGFSLAEGSYAENFRVETLSSTPSELVAGRVYFDEIVRAFKFIVLDSEDNEILRTIPSKEEVYDTFTQTAADLLSNDGGKGAALVGFRGHTGVEGYYSVAAGSLETTVINIITKIDALNKYVDDEIQDLKNELADITIGASGSRLVGYEGTTTTNNHITVNQGSMKTVLDYIAQALDTQIQNVIDNYLNKTTNVTKNVNGEIIFTGPVRFQDSIHQSEAGQIQMGDTVSIGDNNVLLNSDVATDAAPTENAGLSVNRGTEGNLIFLQWNEATQKVEITVKQGDGTFALRRALSLEDYNDLVQQIGDLALSINNTIGQLSDLTTDNKTTIVAAINELESNHNQFLSDLSSVTGDKGTELIGYRGYTGSNNEIVMSAKQLQEVLDDIIQAIDDDRKDEIDWRALLASQNIDEGIKNIGFRGKTGPNGKFSIGAADMQVVVDTVIQAIDNDRKVTADNLAQAVIDLRNAVNDSSAFYESSVAQQNYTWAHNLNSENISIDLWVWSTDELKWVNDIAAITIIDGNNISVDFQKSVLVRLIAKRYDDI